MRFGTNGRRHVAYDDEGNEVPWPFPGHADSIIEALRAHGGTAKPQTRMERSRYDYKEYPVTEILPVDPKARGYERNVGMLNGYLIERGIESGLLIQQEDGSVVLNPERAEAHAQYRAWQKARGREAEARRVLARDFEGYRPRD